MIQIKEYNKILNIIKQHISDGTKSIIKRSEVTHTSLKTVIKNDSCNNSDQKDICFKVVTKVFMINDITTVDENEPRKILFKRKSSSSSYNLVSKSLNNDVLKTIQNLIFDLTDTKFAVVVSDVSYELLTNVISTNFTASCVLSQDQSIEKNSFIQVKSNDKGVMSKFNLSLKNKFSTLGTDVSLDFENLLLNLISTVTKKDPRSNNLTLYTFTILKIYDILLAVLLPRLYCDNPHVVNIWPIVPVSTLYNVENFIKNLKVGPVPQKMFMKLALAKEDATLPVNSLQLKQHFLQGITFPDMIESKMTLLQMYIAYFEEFLSEGKDYFFVSVIPDSASYIRCSHCRVIYDSIFGFLRHWWKVQHILMFRCHICNERMMNMTTLGTHYFEQHLDWNKEIVKPETMAIATNYDKIEKKRLNHFLDEYIPKRRLNDSFKKSKIKRINQSTIFQGKLKKLKEFDEHIVEKIEPKDVLKFNDHFTKNIFACYKTSISYKKWKSSSVI